MLGMPGIGSEAMQNKPLRNGLLGAGLLLIITGIVLSSLGGHASLAMLGQVSMWIGIPILMMGVMIAIVQCSNRSEQQQTSQNTNEESCWQGLRNRFRSGGNRINEGVTVQNQRTNNVNGLSNLVPNDHD